MDVPHIWGHNSETKAQIKKNSKHVDMSSGQSISQSGHIYKICKTTKGLVVDLKVAGRKYYKKVNWLRNIRSELCTSKWDTYRFDELHQGRVVESLWVVELYELWKR